MSNDATPQKGGFLNTVYGIKSSDETRDFYDRWAASYDAEVGSKGYVTPGRCVEALAALTSDRDGAVIDMGCGTGLAGLALRKAGFGTLDGLDLSAEMLAKAETTGAYRRLIQGDMSAVEPGGYANAVAAGVFSPNHAPASAVASGLEAVGVGGCFVFSLNDHAQEDPAYRAAVDALTANGAAELLHDEHGAHLPGIDLKASVLVLRKLR